MFFCDCEYESLARALYWGMFGLYDTFRDYLISDLHDV